MKFNELKKNLKKDFGKRTPLKLAILGDSSTQFLSQSIKGAGYNYEFNLTIFESDYNQIDSKILNINSDLYAFKPEFTLIFEAGHQLLQKFNKSMLNERITFAERQIDHLRLLVETLQKHSQTKIIYFNYCEEDDHVYGNFANKVNLSFIYQQRKVNYLLTEYSTTNPDLFICDLSSIQNTFGRKVLFQPSIYVYSGMLLSIDILPFVANSVLQIISAFKGRLIKCIVLDLDNTIWGGIIGDDGIDKIQIGELGIGKAFTEFQFWIKKLQQRGIIICVCSKNEERIAKEPFEKNPEMVLKLKDISVFVANWENKVDNINHIKNSLNIGFDSMVFFDDNPFERNIVRQNIPGIIIPELPEDPADYLDYLYGLNLFETTSFSNEDSARTELYQKDAMRVDAQKSYANEKDFLKSLKMISKVNSFNSFSIPRIAQLSQRSNQFNLRTIRYSEDDLAHLLESNFFHTFSFTLEDIYGDNGLICAVILREQNGTNLFIDNWFMSCRVLKRGMENFVLNVIVDYAIKNGYCTIIGEYLLTKKNGIVKDHYENLGFHLQNCYWLLETTSYQPKECFININEKEYYGKE